MKKIFTMTLGCFFMMGVSMSVFANEDDDAFHACHRFLPLESVAGTGIPMYPPHSKLINDSHYYFNECMTKYKNKETGDIVQSVENEIENDNQK